MQKIETRNGRETNVKQDSPKLTDRKTRLQKGKERGGEATRVKQNTRLGFDNGRQGGKTRCEVPRDC